MTYQAKRFQLGEDGGVLAVGRDGWLHWVLPDGVEVTVRVREDERGYVPDELRVRAPASAVGVTGTHLRGVALGRLATALQRPSALSEDAGLLAKQVARSWAASKAPVLDPCNPKAKAGMRRAADLPIEELEDAGAGLRLHIPPGRKKPIEFYLDLLVAYRAAALRSRRPAEDLAAANGVTARQIHQWLKLARAARDRYIEEVREEHLGPPTADTPPSSR